MSVSKRLLFEEMEKDAEGKIECARCGLLYDPCLMNFDFTDHVYFCDNCYLEIFGENSYESQM